METKELTIERRLQIYKDALKHIILYKKDWGYWNMGICAAISNVIKMYEPNAYYEMNLYYPELYKYKPANAGINDYWFLPDEEGTQKRISILTEIIKMMENENKK